MYIFRCVCVIAIGLLLHPIFSNGQIPGLYGSTPIALPAITTSSTSVLIPVVNTYRTSVNRGMTVYYFENLFWELALDSAFTRRVAWELWNSRECLTRLDTLPLRIEGIRPDSKHYFRVQVMNVNPTGVDPRDSLVRRFYFSPFTRPMLIETPLQSTPAAPGLLLPTNISHNTITIHWRLAQGLPAFYEVQISTDSTFQSVAQTRTTTITSAQFNNLLPNTIYYYRIRAVNQQGNSPFSSVGQQRTKDKPYSFLTSRVSDQEMQRVIFARDEENAVYYIYTRQPKISLSISDSLVQTIVNQNIAVDSVWFQDTITRFENFGVNSTLIAKARRMDTRLITLGFQTGNRLGFLRIFRCDGGQYYSYHSLMPVSVREYNAVQNNGIDIEVFPNPTNDNISLLLNLPSASEVQYEIWNVLGHLVHSSSKQFLARGAGTIPIATDALPNGVYMVRVALRSASAAPVYLYRQFTVVH